MDITGKKLVVKALKEEKTDTVFGYPGGMIIDIFDELYKEDSIHVVLPRHEQAYDGRRVRNSVGGVHDQPRGFHGNVSRQVYPSGGYPGD